MHSEISGQLTMAIVVAYLIEALKQSKRFPWLTAESDRLNQTVSALVAVVAAAGIVARFDDTTGTLTISGLLPLVAHPLPWMWHALQQFMFQHIFYQKVVKRRSSSKRTRENDEPEPVRSPRRWAKLERQLPMVSS